MPACFSACFLVLLPASRPKKERAEDGRKKLFVSNYLTESAKPETSPQVKLIVADILILLDRNFKKEILFLRF